MSLRALRTLRWNPDVQLPSWLLWTRRAFVKDTTVGCVPWVASGLFIKWVLTMAGRKEGGPSTPNSRLANLLNFSSLGRVHRGSEGGQPASVTAGFKDPVLGCAPSTLFNISFQFTTSVMREQSFRGTVVRAME